MVTTCKRGAGYSMYLAYPNPFGYQAHYLPLHKVNGYWPGQGYSTAAIAQMQPPLQNGQDGPASEELPQTPSADGQVQPTLPNGQNDPPEEESPHTPSGESGDGQVQTPHHSEPDGPTTEELPQTPNGYSPENAISSDDPTF